MIQRKDTTLAGLSATGEGRRRRREEKERGGGRVKQNGAHKARQAQKVSVFD